MMRIFFAFLAWSCIGAGTALAAIPTNDAALLTRKSRTAATTIKLVPITTQRQSANKGVKCAVTKGKKASVTDPTVRAQAGAGSRTIRPYAPELPATPAPGARGAVLNRQTLFKTTGDVVAGLGASRSTLGAVQSALRTLSQQTGSAPTIMGAFDMNSAARLNNNLAWNRAIDSANFWVMALNALNLAMNSDRSRVAIGMRSVRNQATNPAAPACPVGMIGSGTHADPCRAATSCSTTPPGTPVDPGCVSGRTLDSEGNVLFYLARIQAAAQTATVTAPAIQAPLSVADVAAALARIQTNAQ